nr:EAL domain-containing protein [Thiorhodococcus minor]
MARDRWALARAHDLEGCAPRLQDWIGCVHAQDRSLLRAEIAVARDRAGPISLRYRAVVAPDGEARSIEARAETCRDDAGRPIGLVGVAIDVTDQASAEAALRESRAQLRLALRLSQTGVWDWDPHTGRVRWLEGVDALWGLPEGMFQGTYEDLGSRIHPDDLIAWKENVTACVEQGTEHHLEFRVRWPDGSIHWLGAYGNAVRDAHGRATRVAGVVRDITRLKLAEDEQSRFFRLSPNLFLIADGDGRIRRANAAWGDLLGYDGETLIGRSVLDCVDRADVGAMARVLRSLGRASEHVRLECRMRCKGGEARILAWSIAAQPEARLIYAVGQDLTEQRAKDAKLTQAGTRYRELVEHMSDGVAVYRAIDQGRDFVVAQLNPAGEQITGVSAREALGRPLLDAFPGLAATGLKDVLQRVYRSGEAEQVPMLRYADERRDQWIEGRVYKLPSGDVVGVFSDVTRRRLTEQTLEDALKRLESLAYYDQLTGLPNRRLLLDRLQQAMQVADREHSQVAVCYLDLDDFKPINDELGHEAGDGLLRIVAERLRASVRPGDTVARWGGDEFALVLADVGRPGVCAQTLDRILRGLAASNLIEGQPRRISASIGVTLYPKDAADADGLLRHADHALYLAKQGGRNNYQFFDAREDRLAAANRAMLEAIGRAISSDELRLLYQPIVNMRSGRMDGVEVLVRWQHPERGLLLPVDFMPSIEGIELSRRLDLWVLDHALAQQTAWLEAGLQLKLRVNVSTHSLRTSGFLQEIACLLDRYPEARPRGLALEIAESAALAQIDDIASVIGQAELLGISFALDDFGTGFCSLNLFRRLHAPVLKIDRSFVDQMLSDAEDAHVVEGVIGLARAFRREVIAEGVETLAQGQRLLDMGCELAQGYGIAPPMAAAEVSSWIQAYRVPGEWHDCGDARTAC